MITLHLNNCPWCGGAAHITKMEGGYFVATCAKACAQGRGMNEELAASHWNRFRGPQLSLKGDELGAGVPDALARQQILSRVKPDAAQIYEMLGRFPTRRIQQHLDELVASGEVIKEDSNGRAMYRLASDPQPMQGDPMPPRKSPSSTEDAQIPLIDVDTPQLKKVKTELLQYEKLRGENAEETSSRNLAEKEKRGKVLSAIKEAELKPDAAGVYHIRTGGRLYHISQESQLKIRTSLAPKEDDGSGDARE